jgi:hypothetical protein
MRTLTSRRMAAFAITAIALLGLTACTGSPTAAESSDPSSSASAATGTDDASGSDGDQTTAEACQLVQDTITEATDKLENVDSEDPEAIVGGMEAAAESLAGLAPQVTNTEVAALLPTLEDMFGQVADMMSAIVSGDAASVDTEKVGATMQETMAAFQELCGPAQ